jgi:hypothetical protein
MTVFGLPRRAVLLRDLGASRLDALAVERRNAKMLRTIDCLQEWFARSSRRADAMQTARDLLQGDNDQLRTQLEQARAGLTQVLADNGELIGRTTWLEGELADTQRAYRELQEAVQLAAAKKGRK